MGATCTARYFASEIIDSDNIMQLYKGIDITTIPINTPPTFQLHRKKDKIIVIMGATATGKSPFRILLLLCLLFSLSIHLATRYLPSEIIHSTKTQVYEGLDISTNPINTPPTFQLHCNKDKITAIMGATATGKSPLSIHLASSYLPSQIIHSNKMQVYKGLDITTNPIKTPPTFQLHCKKDEIIVIMSATATGKSHLSIDLATRYFPSEISNSDKMQVYKGLDITTNKISLHEGQNIPHHFLGEFDSQDTISDSISRETAPFIVGGANSFIYSLLVEQYNPGFDGVDTFDTFNSVSSSLRCTCCFLWVEEYNPRFDAFDTFNSVISGLRYNCCFLWVDSSLPVLYKYLDKRVEEMFETGMFEELEEYFRESKELKDCVNKDFKSATTCFYSKGELVAFQKTKPVKVSKSGRAENITPGRIRRRQRRRNKKDKDDEDGGEDNRRPSDSYFISLILLILLILMLFLMMVSLIIWLIS